MSWLDYFKKDKQQKTYKVVRNRNWNAAKIDNLLDGWSISSTPINQQLESDLRKLRARSRNLANNDPYMRRFLQLCRSNIVGHKGFSFSSTVKRKVHGTNPDKLAQDIIENGWKEFCRPQIPCYQRKHSMLDIQNLSINQLFRDGEIIIWCYENPNENDFGLSFRFIDPELMDVNHKDQSGKNKIRMGVETDERGRVIAYHFHSTDTTHSYFYQTGGRGYLRIPANQIIHRFFFEYVDQLRGYPQGAASMRRMKHLDSYEETELVAARVGSSTMGFIERGENGQGFTGGVETDDEGNIVVEVTEDEIVVEPAAFQYLDNGAKLHTWDPNHPTTAYKDYVKGVLRGIASGLGIDYNTFANDLEGVNFSSLRGGVLENRELWKCVQDWMIENVMTPIFNKWLKSSLLNEALKLPSGEPLSTANLNRYQAHNFQGRRWAWVDPKKDIETAVIAVNERFRSRSDIIREQGGDPDHVWAEIQKENQILESLNIPIITTPAAPAAGENDDAEEPEPKPEK